MTKQGAAKQHLCKTWQQNDLLGEFKDSFWILKISLSSEKKRKDNIEVCFKKPVEFKYPNNIEDFNMYLDLYQRKRDTKSNDTISMRDDNVFNKLIIVDGGSC